jgi:hypothetical protein
MQAGFKGVYDCIKAFSETDGSARVPQVMTAFGGFVRQSVWLDRVARQAAGGTAALRSETAARRR